MSENKVVFINWEGRTYQYPTSWKLDVMEAHRILGAPVEVTGYDVGLLVRKVGSVGLDGLRVFHLRRNPSRSDCNFLLRRRGRCLSAGSAKP